MSNEFFLVRLLKGSQFSTWWVEQQIPKLKNKYSCCSVMEYHSTLECMQFTMMAFQKIFSWYLLRWFGIWQNFQFWCMNTVAAHLRAAIGLRAPLKNFLLHWNSSLFTVNFGEKVLTLAKGRCKLNRKMVIVCQLMIQLIIALTGFARVIWYGLTSRNSPNYFYQCMLNIS